MNKQIEVFVLTPNTLEDHASSDLDCLSLTFTLHAAE